MPANPQIPIPGNLAELLSNPDRVRDAFMLLNALLNPRFVQVTPSQAGNAPAKLTVTRDAAEFSIAIRWPAGVPPALSGGATLADVIAKVNLMLAGERAVQAPTSQI